MIEAILLGAAAQSALVLSGLAVYGFRVPSKAIGALAGFGAGALIGAIAFDLIPEAQGLHTLAELAL
jgi:ZIP family zinc transporter